MELSELEDAELLAFVGLSKQVIRADKSVSADETSWLEATAKRVGVARWANGIAMAKTTFSVAADVQDAATKVEREEAREAIFDALMLLAGSDDYVPQEAEILDWLARIWSIGDHVPLRRS